MLNRTINIFFFSVALVTLLYFLNVWAQSSFNIITRYGLSTIVISLIFAFFFIFKFKVNNIYKLLFIAFIVYLFWGIILQVTPTTDYKVFYNEALQFHKTFNFKYLQISKSTTTVFYYAVFFAIFGKGLVVSYIAASCAWVVGFILFYKSLINFNIDKNYAILTVAIIAFSPSFIAYAPVISSESVFFLLAFLALYFCSCYFLSKKIYMLGLASLALGLLFITRTNGVVFFISFAFLVGYFFSRLKNKDNSYRIVLASVAPFVIVLFFQGSLNYYYTKNFSISSSHHLAYNFMTGTNRSSKGGYSVSDRKLAGYQGDNKVSREEASRKSVQIAVERISDDPVDFFIFALTDKIEKFWGDDNYGIRWSLRRSPKYSAMVSDGTIKLLQKITNAYYILMMTLFIIWLVLQIRKDTIKLGLFCLPLIGLAVLHIFIEVHARYHMPFMPFVYFGAAGMLMTLRWHFSSSIDSKIIT